MEWEKENISLAPLGAIVKLEDGKIGRVVLAVSISDLDCPVILGDIDPQQQTS